MMIVNDKSSVINKVETLFTNDARVIFYDRHWLIIQAPASLFFAQCTFSELPSIG
jgi:hypothetical protein